MTTPKKDLCPGDLVFTHPVDNPGHFKKKRIYLGTLNIPVYLILSKEVPQLGSTRDATMQQWYKIMSTSRSTGEVKIIKMPENMLTRFEELYE